MREGDLAGPLAAYRRGERTPEQAMAEQQQALAAEGKALGQCSCGSYRLDGKPPILHNDGCTNL